MASSQAMAIAGRANGSRHCARIIAVHKPEEDGIEPWLQLNKAAQFLHFAPKTLRLAAEAGEIGAAVVDVLDGQIELAFMRLGGAAEFRAAVGQHAAELDVVLVEERHDAVVEQVGGGDRGLAVIQLGERHLRVGVDEGLLVDPAHPLEGADIEGVCAPQ
jgi:hypothetical protein